MPKSTFLAHVLVRISNQDLILTLQLMLEKKIIPREMARAKVTLDHLYVPLNIDLVDLRAIPEELKKTVKQECIVWR